MKRICYLLLVQVIAFVSFKVSEEKFFFNSLSAGSYLEKCSVSLHVFVAIYLSSIVRKFSNKGMISSFFFFLISSDTSITKLKKNSTPCNNTDTHNFYEKKKERKCTCSNLYNRTVRQQRGDVGEYINSYFTYSRPDLALF